MTASETIVNMQNAGVERGGRWLVRNLTLQLKRGEIVTLIGPNGSGKSTTSKLALGTLSPNEGEVKRATNVTIATVPQKVKLDWTLPLTVNRFMQLTTKLSHQDMHNALASTGADHLRDNDVHTLSGGEFQRVMLARAIARKPDFLVLDEPVQGVDYAGEITLYELIKSVRNTLGCTILLVSHDLHVVMAATDRVICLNGHICCEGTPSSVAGSPAYKSLFGTQTTNPLALYEHKHDHTHLPDGRVMHKDGSITETCTHLSEEEHNHVG